jgi:radical SAM/Cys-rich protein
MSTTSISGSGLRYQVAPFETRLRLEGVELRRQSIDVIQVNLGRLCNQACTHCHVEAGPTRQEIMDRPMAERVIDFVQAAGANTVDLTGGAPELNPSFRFLVSELRKSGRYVIVRSNLTVLVEENQRDLPEFLANEKVEITASLPCYTEENVAEQRGQGVYQKSIDAIRRLNELGYGEEGSGLVLNLVYNPGGPFLPAPQAALEADYKRELMSRFGLGFNHLYTITNVDIGRFAKTLRRKGEADRYSHLLSGAFNPKTLKNLMCLRMVSLSWDGYLYDCDFNQMLNMQLGDRFSFRLGDEDLAKIVTRLKNRPILTGSHCYACTAGAGSSCSGMLV